MKNNMAQFEVQGSDIIKRPTISVRGCRLIAIVIMTLIASHDSNNDCFGLCSLRDQWHYVVLYASRKNRIFGN